MRQNAFFMRKKFFFCFFHAQKAFCTPMPGAKNSGGAFCTSPPRAKSTMGSDPRARGRAEMVAVSGVGGVARGCWVGLARVYAGGPE